MLVRSRSRNRARGGGSSLDNELLTLASYGASDAWDFVANQYIRAGTVGPSGLTVTRASAGFAETSDGRLVEFASGAPRITDRGVLVEGARTNLATRSSFQTITGSAGSQYPDGTGWSDFFQTGGTRTFVPSAIISGAQAMDISGVSSARSVIGWTFAAASSTTYVVSFYIESVSGVTGVVSFASGTLGSGGTSNNISAPTTTGRVSYTFTTGTGAGNVDVRFGIGTAGPESGSIRISNVQVEAASFASSFIQTEASSATRAADQVTASLSGVAYPLSLYAEFVRNGDTGGFEEILTVRNSTNNYVDLYIGSGDLATASMWSGGSSQGTSPVAGAVSVGALQKVAARYDTNSIRACRNGTLANEDTSATLPAAAPDTIDFGMFVSGTYIFGYLRRAAIIPAALTNAQLQGVTS